MNIEQANKLSFRNRAAVAAAKECGCYFCIRTFPSGEVTEYTDEEQTALCPHCDIDAVLPGVTDKATLAAANERWFCSVKIAR